MRLLSRWLRNLALSTRRACATSALLVLLLAAAILLTGGYVNRAFAGTSLTSRFSVLAEVKTALMRPFPRLRLDQGHQVEYVGMFSADARFRAPSKLDRFADRTGAPLAREVHESEVPPYTLHSYEAAFVDYAPPRHAAAPARVESPSRSLFNDLVTLAYGHQKVLRVPLSVTSDSHQRLIVSDPAIPAVHIIDPKGNGSFRILGGGSRRLSLPGDVAVDADDNVYIADVLQEMVLVYDRYGRFVRSIGTTHEETIFQQVTGIAIDRKAGHLYVADGPEDMVYMLDLQGVVLNRAGQSHGIGKPGELKIRSGSGLREFNYPSHLVVGEDEVVVLDSGGTRIRILDLDCHSIGGFTIRHAAQDHADGVGIDHEGRIYVSYRDTAEIRVYSRAGTMLASFGELGTRIGDFDEPTGLWIDAGNRLYVADTRNARVQVFKLASDTNRNRPSEGTVQASAE